MNWDATTKHEKMVAVSAWEDKYTARFDQELTTAWPDLAQRLTDAVGKLWWHELALGPGPDFKEKQIKPALDNWLKRHVEPIIYAARKEFPISDLPGPPGMTGGVEPGQWGKSALGFGDAIWPGSIVLGTGIVGVSIYAAIGEATVGLIFATIVVSWPLLIGGLIVGGALALFGAGMLVGRHA